jgi:osmotically-inducible protein OsmY
MGKSNDIRAAVIDGDVVLTGNVPSYPQYVQAAAVAARAAGVRCVRNHLRSRWRPAITATT